MAIFVREDATFGLIARRFGGIEGLVAAWEIRARGAPRFPAPRQRSAVYRWIGEGIPDRGDQLVAFCALLDVDPLAIFDYRRNGYFSNFAVIRRNIQLGLAAIGVFSPLYRIYRPGPHWPSNEKICPCFGRNWFAHEFDNAAQQASSDYGLVRARFASPADGPRAVHIAYRRRNSPDTMWRFYGTVVLVEGQLELYSEGGDFRTMPPVEDDEIRFRTYFGGRPVEFRVASLHAFELVIAFPHHDQRTIGFEW